MYDLVPPDYLLHSFRFPYFFQSVRIKKQDSKQFPFYAFFVVKQTLRYANTKVLLSPKEKVGMCIYSITSPKSKGFFTHSQRISLWCNNAREKLFPLQFLCRFVSAELSWIWWLSKIEFGLKRSLCFLSIHSLEGNHVTFCSCIMVGLLAY